MKPSLHSFFNRYGLCDGALDLARFAQSPHLAGA
jgi:hypothetical protein